MATVAQCAAQAVVESVPVQRFVMCDDVVTNWTTSTAIDMQATAPQGGGQAVVESVPPQPFVMCGDVGTNGTTSTAVNTSTRAQSGWASDLVGHLVSVQLFDGHAPMTSRLSAAVVHRSS